MQGAHILFLLLFTNLCLAIAQGQKFGIPSNVLNISPNNMTIPFFHMQITYNHSPITRINTWKNI